MKLRNISLFLAPKLKVLLLNRQSSDCTRCVIKCVPPPPPPISVTVIGANSKVGRISAMLFKDECIYKQMYLHDKKSTYEIACDLNVMNCTPIVTNYHGIKQLENAVAKARIVYICGGLQTSPGFSEIDLFDRNAAWVRQVITYCAEFNPKVHVVIVTPPVSFLVPMAVEEFRKSDINAEKRVYGLTRTLVSRANSLVGHFMNVIPSNIHSFVVGGCHRRNFVPILSHCEPGKCLKESSNKDLTYQIQDAEDAVLRQKMKETDSGGCALSIAYNGVKFTTLLAKALDGAPNIVDCAFVKQDKPMDEYAKYFSCLVNLDKDGIKSTEIPKMSKVEKERLKIVMNEIRHNIFLGSSYVTGDDMIVVRVPPKEDKAKEKLEDKGVKKLASKPTKPECPPKPPPPKTLSIKVVKENPC